MFRPDFGEDNRTLQESQEEWWSITIFFSVQERRHEDKRVHMQIIRSLL